MDNKYGAYLYLLFGLDMHKLDKPMWAMGNWVIDMKPQIISEWTTLIEPIYLLLRF